MLLLNILVFALGFIQTSQARGKIIGGDIIRIPKASYMMQIERNGKTRCGGALIAPNIVLTAAHCVKEGKLDFLNTRFYVRGCSATANLEGKRIEVKQKILSSKYNDETKDWDVAIFILESNMECENEGIKILGLCDGAVPEGAQAQVSGWGVHVKDSKEPSRTLRSTYVTLRNHADCVETYLKYNVTVTENMICANEKNKDSCQGDSGGPLVYLNKICGIVSTGIGCGDFNFPGVYADVNKFSSLIKYVLKNYKMLTEDNSVKYTFISEDMYE